MRWGLLQRGNVKKKFPILYKQVKEILSNLNINDQGQYWGEIFNRQSVKWEKFWAISVAAVKSSIDSLEEKFSIVPSDGKFGQFQFRLKRQRWTLGEISNCPLSLSRWPPYNRSHCSQPNAICVFGKMLILILVAHQEDEDDFLRGSRWLRLIRSAERARTGLKRCHKSFRHVGSHQRDSQEIFTKTLQIQTKENWFENCDEVWSLIFSMMKNLG